MVMIAAGLILLSSICGIVYANAKIKNNNSLKITVQILCVLLAIASAVFILITMYFAWAVRMN